MSGLTAWERWELNSFDEKTPATPGAPSAAADMKMPTADELERIRQTAQEEGYSAGYAAGRAAAQEEAARIGDAAATLDRALSSVNQQVGEDLAALAIEIARQVVRQQITAKPEIILEVIREALLQLPHQHASIYLHPDDAALVRTNLGESLSHAGHRIHEDPALERGGCILETGGSQLDASVPTRWRRVVENLGIASAWDDGEST